MDILGEITLKQSPDGTWNYSYKNIKRNEVIGHLEKMKYLMIKDSFDKKTNAKGNEDEK